MTTTASSLLFTPDNNGILTLIFSWQQGHPHLLSRDNKGILTLTFPWQQGHPHLLSRDNKAILTYFPVTTRASSLTFPWQQGHPCSWGRSRGPPLACRTLQAESSPSSSRGGRPWKWKTTKKKLCFLVSQDIIYYTGLAYFYLFFIKILVPGCYLISYVNLSVFSISAGSREAEKKSRDTSHWKEWWWRWRWFQMILHCIGMVAQRLFSGKLI